MDLNEIKQLIELAREQGLAELSVKEGGTSVRIAFQSAPAASTPAASLEPPPAPSPTAASGTVVVAPLSGTFYRAPAPGEKPFVQVGDRVAVGDVVCIIESMKMMNRIKSEHAGEVAAVLLDDGQAIETGAGLFRIV